MQFIRSIGNRLTRVKKRKLLIALAIATSVHLPVAAADIEVTTNADTGAGSLREALSTAETGDRIVFDISGPATTITLGSDLPTITGDVSFTNNGMIEVIIDRNGFAPLQFDGGTVDPSDLRLVTGGAASADDDIVATAATTVFGEGSVNANLNIAGTLAPGASAVAGTIGTLDVTGNVDLTNGQFQTDLSHTGGTTTSDLLAVDGDATITGATLVPNFVGSNYEIGQQFVVLDATGSITGAFANASEVFELPNNPFLEATLNAPSANERGVLIQDNSLDFVDVTTGCNQLNAAAALDRFRASATPPAAIVALRNGSTDQVALAVDQLSGSIYASLIGAEINHIQTTLESVRDRVVLQADVQPGEAMLTPWIRGYGLIGEVDDDDCQTLGYRQEIGGLELGCGISNGSGLSAHTFMHLSGGEIESRGVRQTADLQSYRMGGSVEYLGENFYGLAAVGAGIQDYDVNRSLDAFEGSDFVESTFDGDSQFGYFEIGTLLNGSGVLWNPYAALHSTRVALDSYAETGDDDFALSGLGGAGDSLRSVLGLAVSKSGATELGTATTRIRMGWLHEYLGESETFVSRIAGDTATNTLSDQGVTAGTDWAIIRAQVDIGVVYGCQLTTAYQGQFNSNSTLNSFVAGGRWTY